MCTLFLHYFDLKSYFIFFNYKNVTLFFIFKYLGRIFLFFLFFIQTISTKKQNTKSFFFYTLHGLFIRDNHI